MSPLMVHCLFDLILYGLKNNCSRQVYDLLIEANNRSVNLLVNHLFIVLKFLFFLESSNL